MTRFLGLLILSLHTAADVRAYLSRAATSLTTLVIAVAFIALSALAQPQTIASPSEASARAVISNTSSGIANMISNPRGEITAVSSPSLIVNQDVKRPQRTEVAAEKDSAASTSTSVPESISQTVSGTLPNNDEGNTADLVQFEDIQLDPVQLSCSDNEPQYTIAGAHVRFINVTNKTFPLSLKWEVKTPNDSSSDVALALPTIPDQSVQAGIKIYEITNGDKAVPLLSYSSPSLNGDIYSIRLHLTAPFDAVSNWQPLPDASTAPACTHTQ